MRQGVVITKVVLSQYSEDWENDEDEDQELVVEFLTAGAGYYPSISTNRWSFDDFADIKKDFEFIAEICKNNDRIVNK